MKYDKVKRDWDSQKEDEENNKRKSEWLEWERYLRKKCTVLQSTGSSTLFSYIVRPCKHELQVD